MEKAGQSVGELVFYLLDDSLEEVHKHLFALLPATTDAQDVIVHVKVCLLKLLQQRFLFVLAVSSFILDHLLQLVNLFGKLTVYLLQNLFGHDAFRLNMQKKIPPLPAVDPRLPVARLSFP